MTTTLHSMRLGRLAQNRRSSKQPLGCTTVIHRETLTTSRFFLYCERWCYICEVLLASSLLIKVPNRGRYKVGNRLTHGAPKIRPSDEPCSQPSHKPRGLPRGFIFLLAALAYVQRRIHHYITSSHICQ